MNQIIKKLASSAAFCIILICALLFSSYVFVPKSSQIKSHLTDSSADGILYEKQNSIDVLVIGDSVAYSSISPLQLWNDYGFTTYICASPAQYLTYSYELLSNSLKNQKPKVVIIEAYSIYRKMSYNKDIFFKLETCFSIFKFHNRWKDMGKKGFMARDQWNDKLHGYNYVPTVSAANNNEYMIKTNNVAPIPEKNIEYIKKIYELCNEHGATLVLMNAPNKKHWTYAHHNGIAALARELGVDYIDMNLLKEAVPIDWTLDTKDKGDHLNHSGAVKSTAYLGNYLIGKFSFTDKRNNPDYEKWNTDYKYYQAQIS